MTTALKLGLLPVGLVLTLAISGAAAAELSPAPQPAFTTAEETEAAKRQNLHALEDAITALESTYGPYHAELSQLFVSLANAQSKLNEHDKTVASLKRAMFIERVNSGIYSNSQSDMLASLIDAAVAKRNWQAANSYLSHWNFITQNSKSDPSDFLASIKQLADTHFNIYLSAEGTDSKNFRHLATAQHWYLTGYRISANHFEESHLNQTQWLYEVTISSFYLNREKLRDSALANSSTPLEGFGERSPLTTASVARANHFRRGKVGILTIIDILNKQDEIDYNSLYDAEMFLADWYQVHNKPDRAKKMYAQAYQKWTTYQTNFSEDTKVNLPKDLPDFKDNFAKNGSPHFAFVRYDISKRGIPRNIEIVESNTADKELLKALKREIAATVFRPQLVEGETIAAVGVVKKYSLNGQ
jgi:hypothetical protein